MLTKPAAITALMACCLTRMKQSGSPSSNIVSLPLANWSQPIAHWHVNLDQMAGLIVTYRGKQITITTEEIFVALSKDQ
jgi:hypothetical protein